MCAPYPYRRVSTYARVDRLFARASHDTLIETLEDARVRHSRLCISPTSKCACATRHLSVLELRIYLPAGSGIQTDVYTYCPRLLSLQRTQACPKANS